LQIVFSGKDLNGNSLLNFETTSTCTDNNPVKVIPVRNGSAANAWQNPHPMGEDKMHSFKYYKCDQQRGPVEGPVDCDACITNTDVLVKPKFTSGSGMSDGAINLIISGSHPTATITWSDENGNLISNEEDLENLAPGEYCLEIVEGCCSVSGCYTISACEGSLTFVTIDPTPEEPNGGAVFSVIEHGNDPYRYKWSTGAITYSLTDKPEGEYCLTVTDNFGCELAGCANLKLCHPIEVIASFNTEEPSGCNTSDGSIRIMSLTTHGGTAPYTRKLINSAGTEFSQNQNGRYANLPSDKYCLVMTDSKGCTGQACVDLTEQMLPTLTIETTKPCVNTANGAISVIALDQNFSTYNFNWNTGYTTTNSIESILSDVLAGNYCVTVTNPNNNCSKQECVNLEAELATGPLGIIGEIQNSCAVRPNGAISLSVSGGVAPYYYKWAGPSIQIPGIPSQQNLSNGTYTVTVTDRCGVSVVEEFVLEGIKMDNLVAIPGCANDGSISIDVSGGTPPYTYSWSNGKSTQNISGLASDMVSFFRTQNSINFAQRWKKRH
jgi:SprB repeat